jgi:hypothetical protein
LSVRLRGIAVSGPDTNWMYGNVEHIEQLVLQQGFSEETMAIYKKVPTILLFKVRHFGHDIARTMVELFQSECSSFEEKTYFLIEFSRSAHGWLRPVHVFAKFS